MRLIEGINATFIEALGVLVVLIGCCGRIGLFWRDI
jgi:hypothetical protein